MIYGIGVDIVEAERIEEIILKKPTFISRVLTPKEQECFKHLKGRRQVEYLGGRFACKEAFSKAYGTGIGKVGLQDIEILSLPTGQPIVTASPFDGQVFVSISHTDKCIIGQIVLEAK